MPGGGRPGPRWRRAVRPVAASALAVAVVLGIIFGDSAPFVIRVIGTVLWAIALMGAAVGVGSYFAVGRRAGLIRRFGNQS